MRRILPEIGVDKPVPIRRLLGMTSGLRDAWELMQLSGVGTDQARTIEDYLDIAFNQRHFSWPPGERNVYTNINFIYMALAIERRIGRPFTQFLADELLKPLGMTATRMRDELVAAFAQADAESDRRVIAAAARIRLETVFDDAPVPAQFARQYLGIHFLAFVQREQSRVAFERAARAGQAAGWSRVEIASSSSSPSNGFCSARLAPRQSASGR